MASCRRAATRTGEASNGTGGARHRDGDVSADGPAASRAPSPGLPTDYQVVVVQSPTVAFYRYLYDTVGADYVWWLRRTMPDDELAMLLRDPRVSIHVLYSGGQPAGFFELDGRGWPDVNLSYFGLMPHAIGAGVGFPFLRSAVDAAWRLGPRGMTVNTCTADHPRALPTYLRAGSAPSAKCARSGTCRCGSACGYPSGFWRSATGGLAVGPPLLKHP